jgi:hypothetical protein
MSESYAAWHQRLGYRAVDELAARNAAEFPGGYFGCCGMSKARGHAELCPKAIAMARVSAANGDLPVPKDCQARPEGIAK